MRQLLVVGDDGSAVAIAAERLGRKETGCGCRRQRADAAVLIGGAEGLSGVIEHEKAFRLRDRHDAVVVGRLPEQIDRYHGFRTKPGLARRGAREFEACRIEVEARLLDVGEDRRGSDEHDDFGGRGER